MNETLSLESTLESPTKPHQQKTSPPKRAIFLVHYMDLNQSFEKIKEKLDKNGNGENSPENKIIKISKRGRKPKKFSKMKKIQNNILDFDIILNTFFPKKKEEQPIPPLKKNLKGKKFHRKILGHKRKRQLKEIINKSKHYLLLNLILI
jgi:hypothetical protein